MPSPLVSCIVPTKNRAGLIHLAIQSFLSQTYRPIELIILDNGDDGTKALIPTAPNIFYHTVIGEQNTGEMRNLCNSLSHGEIICHFDSDDWSAPERVAQQVAKLGEHGVFTGYNTMWFADRRDQTCYFWSDHNPFALGTSMCYRKEWWKTHPFLSQSVGEDHRFFTDALRELQGRVSYVDVGQMMVATIHDHQTSRKHVIFPNYQPVPADHLPPGYHALQHHHQL